jgi:hypothetical protein
MMQMAFCEVLREAAFVVGDEVAPAVVRVTLGDGIPFEAAFVGEDVSKDRRVTFVERADKGGDKTDNVAKIAVRWSAAGLSYHNQIVGRLIRGDTRIAPIARFLIVEGACDRGREGDEE